MNTCRVLMRDGVPLVSELPHLAPPPHERTVAEKDAESFLAHLELQYTDPPGHYRYLRRYAQFFHHLSPVKFGTKHAISTR